MFGVLAANKRSDNTKISSSTASREGGRYPGLFPGLALDVGDARPNDTTHSKICRTLNQLESFHYSRNFIPE